MLFRYEATGIGSVPFKDPAAACRAIYDNFQDIPFWPQLPRRSFLESMYVQYAERLPGLVVDNAKQTIHIDSSKAVSGIEEVYGKYLEGDTGYFAISADHAAGLYSFLETASASCPNARFVKGHITGPVSFALSVTDENKRSIIYDRDLFEVLTKVLVMKARWQIEKLKAICPDAIIFIDEPYLVSIGSSYVNIDLGEAIKSIDEVASAIKSEGALAGLHCCGNTDWPVLLKRDIDILNLDAYNFVKEFSLYSSDIEAFLQRGGTIAWGMVPSSDAASEETAGALASKLGEAIKALAGRGAGTGGISSIVTPSCGVGSLEESSARKVFALAKGLSARMRKG